MKRIITIILLACILSACGGGGSEEGVLFRGQLTQGEVVLHRAEQENVSFRHGAGENIGEVNICALGECSLTDTDGEWGFVENTSFTSGDVLLSLEGHGIDDELLIHVPEGAEDVFLHFENGEDGVIVHHMMVDGVRVEEEHDEDEHVHDDTHEHEDAQEQSMQELSEGEHVHE